jgi:hypothetical protein
MQDWILKWNQELEMSEPLWNYDSQGYQIQAACDDDLKYSLGEHIFL